MTWVTGGERDIVEPVYTDTLPDLVAGLQALYGAEGARDLPANPPLTPIGREIATFLLAHLANAEAYVHVCVRFASAEMTPRGQVRGRLLHRGASAVGPTAAAGPGVRRAR